MPPDLPVIPKDGLRFAPRRCIEPEDAELDRISRGWSEALRDAFDEG